MDKNLQIIAAKPYSIENLGRFGQDHDHITQPDYEFLKKQINNKENYKLKGSFLIDAVPGIIIINF